ncbi:MAG: FkbM family methyltransferase, partial [Leptolyngbya sp. SIO4C5]|nr:FkbM family methyltransferase [Leptolyngbya sp. SIO4C5]
SLFFARSVGKSGKVYTFEANPVNYERVLKNVALNQFANVQVIHIALGDAPGQLKLMFSSVEAGSGSLHTEVQQTQHQDNQVQQIAVPVDTLDHQREVHKLPLPDFIKLDVEGFEPNILKGMEQLLSQTRPDLFIELHGFLMTAERTQYWQNLIYPLIQKGYSIHHIESDRKVTADMPDPPLAGHLYCQIDQD